MVESQKGIWHDVLVWKKDADGDWHIFLDLWNSRPR
jgi:hypothetical protein